MTGDNVSKPDFGSLFGVFLQSDDLMCALRSDAVRASRASIRDAMVVHSSWGGCAIGPTSGVVSTQAASIGRMLSGYAS